MAKTQKEFGHIRLQKEKEFSKFKKRQLNTIQKEIAPK